MGQSGSMHHTAAYQVDNSASGSRGKTGTSQHLAGDPTSSLSRGDTSFHQQQVIQGTRHSAIVDADEETESTPDVSGCPVLPPSLSSEARNRNATLRVCIVKSSWSPHGPIRLQGLDHPVRALEIKKGQEGFVLGDGMNDDAGNTWMRYARARSSNAKDKGWVMQNLLNIGQEAGKVKIVDNRPIIPQPNTDPKTQGSRLQKTVSMLYTDITAVRDSLIRIGAGLVGMNAVRDFAGEIETSFINGKSTALERKGIFNLTKS